MEAPALGKIQQEFKDDGLYVLAINISPFGSLEQWKTYWKSKDASDVIWAEDHEQEVVRLLRVLSLGTTIIIDRQGRITYRDDGATSYNTLRAKIEDVL